MLSELPDNSSYILYGNLSGEKLSVEPQLLITANKRAEGFFLGNWTAEKGMFKTIQNLLRVNRLIKSGMGSPVQAKFRLTRTQEAVDLYLNNMTRGKVLLCPADEI
jgi:hypothetical protein